MMKIIWRKLSYRYPTIRCIYNKSKILFFIKDKIHKRRLRDKTIFNFLELSQDYPFYTTECYGQNELYGNNMAVKAFLKLPRHKSLNGIIEHGLYFGEYFYEDEVNFNGSGKYFTFSDYRRAALEKGGISAENITVVGPYIVHTPSLIETPWFKRTKEELKKTLTVFAAHSIDGFNSDYEAQELITEIEKIKNTGSFDTVLICLYWKDIQDKKYIPFENAGYKIVTAGHQNDSEFLSRLRLIIELSDSTMSNLLGTHLGYCIALGKPHYYFAHMVVQTGPKVDAAFEGERGQLIAQEKKLFAEMFGKYSEKITTEQLKLVHRYWGPF
ncbi:MAG: hypothetical protein JXR95_15205 [Deltaproteobacteria bacterium]|nr:hypothetical protein [Deltaproteobacteria bacterium]